MKLLLIIMFWCNTFVSNIDQDIPAKNKEFVNFVENRGKEIAPTYAKANCVQFMDRVLTDFVNISEFASEKIYINEDISHVEKLLKRGDSSIVSGVCAALVDCGKADWIKPENAKRGDIIQYWTTNGFTNGHCGIIYGEDESGYILLSSHQESNGYGKMNTNHKNLKNVTIFIVRLK